jgi:hypothetical protein
MECQAFLSPQGCRYGAQCKFSHAGRRTVQGQGLVATGVCRSFGSVEGCKYGGACRFRHDARDPAQERLERERQQRELEQREEVLIQQQAIRSQKRARRICALGKMGFSAAYLFNVGIHSLLLLGIDEQYNDSFDFAETLLELSGRKGHSVASWLWPILDAHRSAALQGSDRGERRAWLTLVLHKHSEEPNARYLLALMGDSGDFRVAAEGGCIPAFSYVVARDEAEQQVWLQRGAEQGDAACLYALSRRWLPFLLHNFSFTRLTYWLC